MVPFCSTTSETSQTLPHEAAWLPARGCCLHSSKNLHVYFEFPGLLSAPKADSAQLQNRRHACSQFIFFFFYIITKKGKMF